MPVNYTVLKNECQNDPRGYGLTTPYNAGSLQVVADALNVVRTTANPGANPTADGGEPDGEIHVKRLAISPEELLEAIDVRDFPTSPGQVNNLTLTGSWLESVLQLRQVRLLNDAGQNNIIRTNLNRLLGDTQGSQTRLNNLSVKLGSRAEELFGDGTVLTHSDIAQAKSS